MDLNLKELVKQHFNLVEAEVETFVDETPETEVTETFARIKTADGELEMEYDELAAGKPIFLITEDGNIPAPTGDYILEDGKAVRVEEGMIAEVKEVEGMEDEVPAEEKTEMAEEVVEDEMEDEVEEEMEEKEDQIAGLVDAIEAAVISKIDEMSQKIEEMEAKVAKMSEIPATEPTVVKSQRKPAETFSTFKKTDVESRREQLLNQIKNQ